MNKIQQKKKQKKQKKTIQLIDQSLLSLIKRSFNAYISAFRVSVTNAHLFFFKIIKLWKMATRLKHSAIVFCFLAHNKEDRVPGELTGSMCTRLPFPAQLPFLTSSSTTLSRLGSTALRSLLCSCLSPVCMSWLCGSKHQMSFVNMNVFNYLWWIFFFS